MSRALLRPLALIAVMLLAAWAYWPGLSGPLLLDDEANLRDLQSVERVRDYPMDVVRGNKSGLFGRTIPMASFVIEARWFGNDPRVQKMTNLWLHLLNGGLVYLLSAMLLIRMRQESPHLKALLVCAAWLFSPLLLSTVLYVVQRMAILSTTFSLLAVILYCRARLAAGTLRVACFAAAGLMVLAATLSKENGILALPLMLVIEAYVFRFHGLEELDRRRVLRALATAVGFVTLLLLLLPVLWPDLLLGQYVHRSFSLPERLLTEARVLWDYLGQLAWVDIDRLGVYHDDYVVSSGVNSPLVTLWAILGWILVAFIAALALLTGRGRIPAFALAFFLVGHAMESTFYPLEIYFEHRNYLPAVGFYFGLVAGFGWLADRYRFLRGWLLTLALLVLFRSLVLLGMQSMLWSSDWLIHMNAVNQHPRSERALVELGQMYANVGQLEEAVDMLERADKLSGEGVGEFTRSLRRVYFHCLSNRPLGSDFALPERIDPVDLRRGKSTDVLYGIMRAHGKGRCPKVDVSLIADRILDLSQGEFRELLNPKLLSTLVLLENNLQRYEHSFDYTTMLLLREPEDVMGLQFRMYLAQRLQRPGESEQALQTLRQLADQGKLNGEQRYNLALFDPESAGVEP